MPQSVELFKSSVSKENPKASVDNPRAHSHTHRTREDLLWALASEINPSKKMSLLFKPPVLGKGWEVPCTRTCLQMHKAA